jgi:hypothetical protein
MSLTIERCRGANRSPWRDKVNAFLPCLLLLLLLLVAPMAAQSPAPPTDTIRLANGTVLLGHIASFSNAKVHILVDGMGEVTVDSSALIAAAPRQMGAPSMAAPPHSPWSGTLSASGAYVSEVVPDLVGSALGVQVAATLARTTPTGAVTLDGALGYWRVEPDAAALDQWSLALGWRHDLAPRFPVLAKTSFDVNRVQTLKYRSTTLAGIGYAFVKQPRVTLTAAPGLGYARSEQTTRGRVLSFAGGKSPTVDGFAWGAHEMLMAQLTPTLGLQQNMLWLHGFSDASYRQLQLDARLTAMVMKHLGLLIVFTQQYDSSMPAPVSKTIRTLNPGIQLVF